MRNPLSAVFSWAYFVAIYSFIFLPVAVLVLFSFQDGRLPIPPFNGVTFKWYAEVFADSRLMSALGNSLTVAALSSVVACVLGFCAAYGLARYRLPGTAFQRVLLTAPMTVSYFAGFVSAIQLDWYKAFAMDRWHRPRRHKPATMFRHYLCLHGRPSEKYRTRCA
jgi:ABC-type spermidine/putrescine transport system permease subunit II